jgi:hypothetical protein
MIEATMMVVEKEHVDCFGGRMCYIVTGVVETFSV